MEDNLDACLNYCVGCLTAISERQNLYNYTFLCSSIKHIFKTQSLLLCYVCKRIAQHTEMFIQKVQSNQILLENFGNVTDETIKSLSLQIEPLVNLNKVSYNIVEVSETEDNFTDTEERLYVISHSSIGINDYFIHTNTTVKKEIKQEAEMFFNAQLNNDDNDFPDLYFKEENGIPLTENLEEELEGGMDEFLENKILQMKCEMNKETTKKLKTGIFKVKTIYLTKTQILEERLKMAEDPRYLNCIYKCIDCIKAFSWKGSYDIHMEKHNQCVGDYECDICKQRTKSKEKLISHIRRHEVRYKCLECGLIRRCRDSIKQHYSLYHLKTNQHSCAQCMKTFRRSAGLRRHISHVHGETERVQCAYCSRTYCEKSVLREHMWKHTKEMSTTNNAPIKKYICSQCGQSFKTPSQLKYHNIKHLNNKDFYCVECDKSFKSKYSLKYHLKSVSLHVDYKELPLGCSHCEKRFYTRRDVTRHTNRVHLKLKPYACDKCDKAYGTSWSLKEHQKYAHDGYKRPLQFPCPVCDKIFDRNSILKNHIRIHTGERPYQCAKCPATFNQASILRTHDRLVHLKLTRTVRYKNVANK